MKLVLLRHGVSYSNFGVLVPIQSQNLLSAKGIDSVAKSAVDFANLHQDVNFDFVFSSTYSRAVQTAMNFLSYRGNKPVTIDYDERIVERHYGFTEFIGYHDLIGKFGRDEVESWDNHFDKAPSPEGETQIQVYQRTMDFFEEKVRPLFGSGDILIVAHFYILRALQSHFACGSYHKMNDWKPLNCDPVIFDQSKIEF